MQTPFVDPLSNFKVQQSALPLLGRGHEMQVVDEILGMKVPGKARALFISGPPGMGKSRLLAEIYSEARKKGCIVIDGGVYGPDQSSPYMPFIEALRPLLVQSPVEKVRAYFQLPAMRTHSHTATNGAHAMEKDGQVATIDDEYVSVMLRFFPELQSTLVIRAANTPHSEDMLDQEKFRLFDSIATFLERLADEQTVVLGIDNMQWVDSASLDLFLYLIVRLRRSRVLMVGTARPLHRGADATAHDFVADMPETGHGLKTLHTLVDQGLLRLLTLSPLSSEEAERYIHVLLPGQVAEEIISSVLTRCGGNPFFLEELVRMLVLNQYVSYDGAHWKVQKAITRVLPDGISLAVKGRISELSQSCRELLRIAALFGRTFPFDALVRVADQSGIPEVETLLAEAVDAHIIALTTQSDGPEEATLQWLVPTYVFGQGIVQEVLARELSLPRARSLHLAICQALASTYHLALADHVMEIAHHAKLSGDKALTLHWSLRAGEHALHRLSYREALGYYHLAVQLFEAGETSDLVSSHVELLLHFADLLFRIGELERAGGAFGRVLTLLQQDSERLADGPLFFSQANRMLSDIYRMQGKYELALGHLQAAFAKMPPADPHEDAETMTLLSSSTRTGGKSVGQPDSEAIWPKGPGASRSLKERMLLLQAQATFSILGGQVPAAEAVLWQAYQCATSLADRNGQAFSLHFLGYIRGWGEHIHEAIRLQTQALDIYIAIGDPLRSIIGEQVLGIIYQAIGETTQARMYTERGLARSQTHAITAHLGWLYWNFSILALTQGDWQACLHYLQQAELTPAPRLKPVVFQTRGCVLFRQGEWEQAEQAFHESVQSAMNTEWYPGALAFYGHFLALSGKRAVARTHLDRAAQYPVPPGYAGDFYIPFLVEGYLVLGEEVQVENYLARISPLTGYMYYGYSVDRILSIVQRKEEDWQRAEQSLERGLALCQRANNKPEEAAILFEQAQVLWWQQRTQSIAILPQTVEQIRQLCAQATTLFTAYGLQPLQNQIQTFLESTQEWLQKQQQEEQVTSHKPSTRYALDFNLTQREREVLKLVAEGQTDREVADTLVISHRTVHRHLSNIFVKLDVPGRAAAVAYAIRHGLV